MSELQQVADGLAGRLRRSVTVVDPDIRIVCASRHFGDEDDARVRAILQREALPDVSRHILAQGVRAWTAPGRIPGAPELGFRQRLAIPVRRRGVLLGLMMIIDADGTLSPNDVAAAEHATHLIAELLDREPAEPAHDTARITEILSGLISPPNADRERALWRATGLFGAECHVAVVRLGVLNSPADAEDWQLPWDIRTGLESFCHSRPEVLHVLPQGRHATVLQFTHTEPTAEDVRDLAYAAVADLRHRCGDECVAGAPESATGLAGVWHAYREADLALRAASLLRHLRPVATTDELGVYGALLRVPTDQLPHVVPGPLKRLMSHDPHGVLRETLRAYLDAAGAAPATAERLHIHRTSLYYRLHQIERRTGLDLRSGPDRLTLHLGLAAAEILTAAKLESS